MSSTNYILWGATGQALVLHECLGYYNKNLLAVFDNNPNQTSPFKNIPIFYGENGLRQWMKRNIQNDEPIEAYIAIGGNRGVDRLVLQNKLLSYGFLIQTVIHPSSFIARDCTIGAGCQILGLAAVCSHANIGDSCIINTGAIVEHGCILNDAIHIGPNATIAGEVTIEKGVFVGAGAVVLPRLHIGKLAIIGAGSVVTKDVPANTVIYGNPAKEHKK